MTTLTTPDGSMEIVIENIAAVGAVVPASNQGTRGGWSIRLWEVKVYFWNNGDLLSPLHVYARKASELEAWCEQLRELLNR